MRMTQDMEDDEKGKLFVGGLSWETTQENLQRYFARYGEVIDCVVMKNNESGRSRGFGFVTFSDPNNVNIVLQNGPHNLDGRTIDPKPCNPRTLQKPKRCGGYPKVFLGGLPSNVTETDLRMFFNQYGKVMEVVIMYDQEKKKSRGFGFLSFEDEVSVDRVTGEHYINIHGKQVEIKKAEPRDGSTQPQINNMNNHQFNNMINNNINNHHHHHNQHLQQPHQHHPLPPLHHMHLNHHRNINNTNNSGSSSSSVVNNNNKINNADNTQWNSSLQPQGAPMSMMQQQTHPNGPNGQMSGGGVGVNATAGGVAQMNPMAPGMAPNMMQGYQGGWGTSPQQSGAGGGAGGGFGYGAPNGPGGSYGGGWGAPPPPPGPQAPPPHHQWSNYAPVQQQSQNYDIYSSTGGPNGSTSATGAASAGSWNTWNTTSPAGGVSAGDMYPRSAQSAGPTSGTSANNVNKSADYGNYTNVVPTVTGYGNYSNDQNSTYGGGATPRNFSNENAGAQPVNYAQPLQDEFLKPY